MTSTPVPGRVPAALSSPAVLGAALAAVAFTATLSLLSHGGVFPDGPGRFDAVGVLLAAGSTLPLAAWKRLGAAAFAVTAAFGTALAAAGYAADLLLGPAAALFLIAAHRVEPSAAAPSAASTAPPATAPPSTARPSATPTRTRGTAVLVIGAFTAYLAAAAFAQEAFPTSAALHTGLAWAAAWFAGERTRLSREHLADLRLRADRAERDAERERRLAAAEERARIARDLHDSAGHAISVIAVRAGAARLRGDPEHALRALEAVEDLARRTAADIDRLVATLRDDEARPAPVGLASLETLVAGHTEAGLDVALRVEGRERPLAAVADQAAYRILQEALTNAARHGAPPVEVTVAWGPDEVALTVVNGPGTADGARPGGGHGLIGMRERAERSGGAFTAGPEHGRFRLRATIPYGRPER